MTVKPIPQFVIKTEILATSEKIFLNIISLADINPTTAAYISMIKNDKDIRGSDCKCVDFAVHPSSIPAAGAPEDAMQNFVLKAINLSSISLKDRKGMLNIRILTLFHTKN